MWAVTVDEANTFARWMYGQRAKVAFNPAPLSYMRACMAIASVGDDPLLFVPFHPVIWLEAMAQNPEASPCQKAMGLWRINEQLARAMADTGMYESRFLCNDEDEVKAVTRRGWIIELHDPEKKVWLMRRILPPEERAIPVSKAEPDE